MSIKVKESRDQDFHGSPEQSAGENGLWVLLSNYFLEPIDLVLPFVNTMTYFPDLCKLNVAYLNKGKLRMPRTSPYQIELSDSEREELESLARKYTAPYQVVVRANIDLDGFWACARLSTV